MTPRTESSLSERAQVVAWLRREATQSALTYAAKDERRRITQIAAEWIRDGRHMDPCPSCNDQERAAWDRCRACAPSGAWRDRANA